jgi:hypothetical protein
LERRQRGAQLVDLAGQQSNLKFDNVEGSAIGVVGRVQAGSQRPRYSRSDRRHRPAQ